MKTSDAGLEIVKKYEGLRLSAYPDPATNGEPYTIGYGLTSASGVVDVKPGMRITLADADRLLRRALIKYEGIVAGLLKRPATPAQFDAMVSLCYNVGGENFRRSSVLRKFNAGDLNGAADAFLLFNKANGKVLNGLINRRKAERDLFLIGSGKSVADSDVPPSAKVDPEPIASDRKPVYRHRRVWASIVGWLGGGGVATFASFSGFDYRTLLVLVAAIAMFVAFFWFIYRREIREGLFSK